MSNKRNTKRRNNRNRNKNKKKKTKKQKRAARRRQRRQRLVLKDLAAAICSFDGADYTICCAGMDDDDDDDDDPIDPIDNRSCGKRVRDIEKSLDIPRDVAQNTVSNDLDTVCIKNQPVNVLPESKRLYTLPPTILRIVGGDPADPKTWPWAVLLGRVEAANKFTVICGGTLISERHVLTAAHCFPEDASEDTKIVTARMGEYDITTTTESDHFDRALCNTQIHENYRISSEGVFNDVALLTLCGDPIPLDDPDSEIQPACLPEAGIAAGEAAAKDDFTVIGWGATRNYGGPVDHLREAKVTPQPLAECQQASAF